jgi:hypothetical protein
LKVVLLAQKKIKKREGAMDTHTAIIYKGEALPPFDARKGTKW